MGERVYRTGKWTAYTATGNAPASRDEMDLDPRHARALMRLAAGRKLMVSEDMPNDVARAVTAVYGMRQAIAIAFAHTPPDQVQALGLMHARDLLMAIVGCEHHPALDVWSKLVRPGRPGPTISDQELRLDLLAIIGELAKRENPETARPFKRTAAALRITAIVNKVPGVHFRAQDLDKWRTDNFPRSLIEGLDGSRKAGKTGKVADAKRMIERAIAKRADELRLEEKTLEELDAVALKLALQLVPAATQVLAWEAAEPAEA